jgi:hypothetical protein
MIADHYIAVRDQLMADPALKVRDSADIDSTTGGLVRSQYVILYPAGPDEMDDERFTKPQDLASTAEFLYSLRAVSTTSLGCAAVADHVLVQLVGFVPSIPGRNCDRIAYEEMADIEPDFSVKPPLYFSEMRFTLVSRRA